ncbi:Polynucleotidyl transferase- ribonuclease H-like superfamily protein [Striga hermonthica]|uniref:Polynucleotidyl transferase- ribonuclease H-like superfamily protein n=1 Tax=Striga hermonthica TaxID=68872 RepID=A0A9N7NP20_STRHE|nr:Polynucleotidyl transferase- ribonuclease H-like superfamily protein [Striga hermonthica]
MLQRWANGIGSFSPPSCLLRISFSSPEFYLLRRARPRSFVLGMVFQWAFLTRSAYVSLSAVETGPKPRLWKVIWRWVGPQRMKQFSWLVAKDRLLTNGERHHRQMVDSPLCELCQTCPETTLHALRNREIPSLFWKKLVPRSCLLTFFDMELGIWLETNLSMHVNITDDSWDVSFGVGLWRLWKGRNNQIFNGLVPLVDREINGLRHKVNSLQKALDIEEGKQQVGQFGEWLKAMEIGRMGGSSQNSSPSQTHSNLHTQWNHSNPGQMNSTNAEQEMGRSNGGIPLSNHPNDNLSAALVVSSEINTGNFQPVIQGEDHNLSLWVQPVVEENKRIDDNRKRSRGYSTKPNRSGSCDET